MKLSKIAILALKGSDVDFKKELAKVLNISVQTAYRYIATEDDTLTKASALDLISAHTGLSISDLLEKQEQATA